MAKGYKMSLYVPEEIVEQMEQEHWRQDRSMSWLVKQAWKVAYPTLQKFPDTAGERR
jgi:uncharacterized small protein (TIGR04563 family)